MQLVLELLAAYAGVLFSFQIGALARDCEQSSSSLVSFRSHLRKSPL